MKFNQYSKYPLLHLYALDGVGLAIAEDAVRDAVERAALRELLNEERLHAEMGVAQAALDVEQDSGKDGE